MARGTFPTPERRPWMSLFIWGWRFELGLSATALVALSIAERLGSAGPLLVASLVALVLHERPDLRESLARRTQTNRAERRLHAAL